MRTISIALIAFASAGCGGCKNLIDDTVTPVETIFEHLIAQPLKITATNLQGGGHTWQGYTVHLRFTPSKPIADVLLADGYAEVSFGEEAYKFCVPPEFASRFSPPWDVINVKQRRCFKKEISSGWTTAGTHRFIIDNETGTVYFYGFGI